MSKKKIEKTNSLNKAIHSGIESIIDEHPRFANFQEYLLKHIDQKKVQEKVNELYEEAYNKKMTEEKAYKHIYTGLADYVASGSVLDDKGKEVVLKNSLEEKSKNIFQKIFHKRKFDGEKYLDNTMEAFNDLYSLFKSGDYSERMPELTESVTTLYDLQFLDPAVDVLKAYGLIDKRKYEFLKKNIYTRTGKESKKVVEGIERYIVPQEAKEKEMIPQKMAASIIGLFGVVLISSNLNITGATIGNYPNITISIFGILMLFLSILLFLKNKKRNFKK